MALPLMSPNKAQLQRIYDNLGVDETRHQHLLNAFKKWISTEKHLPQDLEENYLSHFLLLCKDDLSKAKIKFETNIINRNSQFFSKINFKPGIVDLNITRQLFFAPNLTENGYIIIYYSLPETAEEYNFYSLLNYILNTVDVMIFEAIFSGAIFVLDYKNISPEILLKTELNTFADLLKYLLNGFPHRLINVHIINSNQLVKPVLMLIKATMTEKLRKRFLIHNQVEDLLNYLPKAHLPIEYGGNDFNLNDLTKHWKKYFETNNLENKLGKLRVQGEIPKRKITLDSGCGFGNDGTFRNLQVD